MRIGKTTFLAGITSLMLGCGGAPDVPPLSPYSLFPAYLGPVTRVGGLPDVPDEQAPSGEPLDTEIDESVENSQKFQHYETQTYSTTETSYFFEGTGKISFAYIEKAATKYPGVIDLDVRVKRIEMKSWQTLIGIAGYYSTGEILRVQADIEEHKDTE